MEIEELKLACMNCRRFQALVKVLDVRKMADVPPMDFSNLPIKEQVKMIKWIKCETYDVPDVIAAYIQKCT